MGLRFRRTFKVFPGVHLNISKGGVSASIGVPGATLNVGKNGAQLTGGIPGTGISYRQRLAGPLTSPRQATPPPAPRLPVPAPGASPAIAQPVVVTKPLMESAPIDQLTSASLREVRDLVAAAHKESVRLQADLGPAEKRKEDAQKRAYAWEHDEVRRTLFAGKYEKVLDEYEDARDDLKEIKAHLETCKITLGMESSVWLDTTFGALVIAFRDLAGSAKCWDITRQVEVNNFAERSSAKLAVNRTQIVLDVRPSKVLEHAGPTLHFQNANGGDLFLYPAMLMVANPGAQFALIDLNEVHASCDRTRFNEEEVVPADAQVVGETWKRVNMDGTPDRRYADNHSIPVVAYGTLRLSSPTGLKEEYMFSSVEKLRAFCTALGEHMDALARGGAASG